MSSPSRGTQGLIRYLWIIGWVAAPLVLAAFVILYFTPGHAALVVRQLVFLLPLTVAVVAGAGVLVIAPAGAERRGWALLGSGLAFVLSAEVYFSAYQVFVSPAGPSAFSAYDILNAVAALFVVAAIGVAVGVDRLPQSAMYRSIADVVASSSVVVLLLYHVWVRILGGPATPWQVGLRWASYSFLGVGILGGVLWLTRDTRAAYDRGVVALLAPALSIFALGMALWPVWQAGDRGAGPGLIDVLVSSIFLVSYILIMLAVLTRLRIADRGWRTTMGRLSSGDSVWISTAVPAVVLTAAGVTGWWAYHAPFGSAERVLYVALASIAIFALVARTGFATSEAGILKNASSIDPVTGAYNYRAFQDACEERILTGRRRGTPFTLVVIDLDGFSRVNAMLGHTEGDLALRTIVDALELVGGRAASVFRLTGDEFAVIGTGIGKAESHAFATQLLCAIEVVRPAPGMRMSASIGVVPVETFDTPKEELFRRADAAQEWAKYHGKGHVVAYDQQIVRALNIEERMRLREEQSYLGVARALAAAADARDARNRYHSHNLAALAVLLAEEIGFDHGRTRAVEIAAMLHDVGAIAMPDATTPAFRPGARDSVEAQEHSVIGEQLVESLGIEGLPSWVRGHHEWWDGSGYPDGLTGEAIPLEARMIALADAYDGMTSGRRGGSKMSKSAALQEIDHQIGTRFDPELAERFILVVGRTSSLGWSDERAAS